MTEHDNAFFAAGPETDESFLIIAPKRTGAELAALRTRLESLPVEIACDMDARWRMARSPQPLDGKKVLAYGKSAKGGKFKVQISAE